MRYLTSCGRVAAAPGETEDGLFVPVNVFYWLCDGQTTEQRIARGPPYLGATVTIEFEKIETFGEQEKR